MSSRLAFASAAVPLLDGLHTPAPHSDLALDGEHDPLGMRTHSGPVAERSSAASESPAALRRSSLDSVARAAPQRSPKTWIDPAVLPSYEHAAPIGGNAPALVKQLNYNTVMFYGVGEPDSFGYAVGSALRFVDVSVRESGDGRREATTTAEVLVTKHMLNGAGMLHGGCVAYLIDNCCSTPLVVLGILKGTNGVGVTQSMNILFHAPAPLGTCLQIISTSIAMGGRVMSARCELLDKSSGRIVASSFLTKMQPAKL